MPEQPYFDGDDEPTLIREIEIEHSGTVDDGRLGPDFAVRGRVIAFHEIEPHSLMPSGDEGQTTRCAIKLKNGETVLIGEDLYSSFIEWFNERKAENEEPGGPPRSGINQTICEAIARRKLLQFSYDDLTRIVEPHLLGRKTSGNDVLSAYMIEGYTESDHDPYWRNYAVEKIEFMIVLDETFEGAREGYNPEDQSMEEIYCRL
jgi:hypothetical protein